MKNKTIFMLAALILFVISAVVGYFGPGFFRELNAHKERAFFSASAIPSQLVKNFAHHFAALEVLDEPQQLPPEGFLDLKGRSVQIADFAGKPYLVNMWATWCTPCVKELPSLEAFQKAYEGRIGVVAIAMEPGRPLKDIAGFLEKRKVGNFAGYLDQKGDFGRNLGMRGIPTSFLIGSHGQIIYRFEGDADWIHPDSRAFFDAFLIQNK